MDSLGGTGFLTLHGLFLEASTAFASNPAVVYDNGAESVMVDYGTLATLSGELAVQLRQHGIGHNQVVAISSTEYDQVLIAILGILQVPAAFTFIPPDAPAKRTLNLLSQLRVPLLITNQEIVKGRLRDLGSSFHISTKAVDISGRTSFMFADLEPLDVHVRTEASSVTSPLLAYVVCTSGTTGKPKVVRVPHQCIVPNITHLRKIFEVSPSDVIFNASPLTFDPSIVEIFLALSSGATLVTVSDLLKRTPNQMVSALVRHSVSILQVTPSFLGRISPEQLSTTVLCSNTNLRILAFGGEPCPSVAKLSKWVGKDNKTEIFNLYGITEVSSWASCQHLNRELRSTESIPLGQPLWDTLLEVRDESGAVISEGEGRLFIGFDVECELSLFLPDPLKAELTEKKPALSDSPILIQSGSNTRICITDDESYPTDEEPVFRDSVSGGYSAIAGAGLARPAFGRDGLEWGGRVRAPNVGDYVKFTPSGLVFMGRKDDQLKRFGKRFSLKEVKMALESFPEVSQGEVSANKSHNPARLYAFYMPVSDTGSRERISVTEAGQRLKVQLEDHLPEHCIPDHVFTVLTFPMTDHGKLDVRRLTESAREYLDERCMSSRASTMNLMSEECEKLIEGYLKEALSLTESPDRQKTFIELGGNSLQAVMLVERLDQWCGRTDTDLLDLILHHCIGAVMNKFTANRRTHLDRHGLSLPEVALKKSASDQWTAPGGSEMSPPEATSSQNTADREARTANSTRYAVSGLTEKTCNREEYPKNGPESEIEKLTPTENLSDRDSARLRAAPRKRKELSENLNNTSKSVRGLNWTKRKRRRENSVDDVDSKEIVRTIKRGDCVVGPEGIPVVAMETEGRQKQMVLREDWSVDLEKCIDASPLIVMDEMLLHAVVFIGSHSGTFVAIDTVTSKKLWQVRLPDRIESSACLSPCKRFVVVGCYDNKVYFFDRYNGTQYWSFTTHGMVKSSPHPSKDTGLVYIGSHDGNLYALDAVTQTCRFSAHVGGGSVFSSPCVDPLNEAVYVASLSGRFLCISWTSGDLKWSYQCPKPLFSSPAVTSTGVIIGCVDGYIYCFNHSGKLVYNISTEAPIFSSPCVIRSSQKEETFLIGSHDGHVYCLTNGSIRWRTKIGKHVYSTPSCIFNSIHKETGCSVVPVGGMSYVDWTQGLVSCCSTDGTFVILNLATGEVLSSYQLPGELFSSPVFMEDGRVIVACRNDNLFCLSLVS